MKFFLDNNLGRQLADGMHAFGEDVTHILDHFKPDSRDTDWLPIVGEKQWILITRDERIRYNPLEKAELVSNGVGAFFLGGKNRSRCELIQQLVRNWPRIKELAGATKRPFAFRIPPSGTKMQRIL
ncbi:MAG: DUF5615 family PIN-like protein [candidate division Zixibacteria bacterium]|nr:DUF5615 family PIN-like protein [candidate division Zixibacteria bacterium]